MGVARRRSYGQRMTTTGAAPTTTKAAGLRRWMRIVGGFYLVMGAFNTPPVIQARFGAQYAELGLAVDSPAAQALVDVWFMFGLEVAVIGAALLYFSSDPARHLALVWTVLGLELVRGVVDDLYLIARGYDPRIYGLWVLIHLVIIVTGVAAIRGSRADAGRSSHAARSSR